MRSTLSNRRALDPFAGLRHFDALFNADLARASSPAAWAPPVDVIEDADGWRLIAELPGIAPEQVKLTVDARVLTIAGEKAAPDTGTEMVRSERRFGSFSRSFALGELADLDHIAADYANGLLTVMVPKAPQAKPREIAVRIGVREG